MISSDKAVNPTNVMGTTKRVAEKIVSAMPSVPTKFVSVRFGNVLGSNGSVIPLFQRQIASGGPVTVTDPEVRRFFMSIREAVQLVLQAFTMGHGSEIFVLDMGEPVRISDLAKQMITLSGSVPGRDIDIKYIGLRPGEKLFEELALESEDILPTENQKIRIYHNQPVSAEAISRWVVRLEALIEDRNEAAIIGHLCELVPEYQPSGQLAAGATKGAQRATGAAAGTRA
jgi:FlaA1/EpsC-like NDP-sugar epimerase